jgi:hypothetical protein
MYVSGSNATNSPNLQQQLKQKKKRKEKMRRKKKNLELQSRHVD